MVSPGPRLPTLCFCSPFLFMRVSIFWYLPACHPDQVIAASAEASARRDQRVAMCLKTKEKSSLRIDPSHREDSGQALPALALRLARDDRRAGHRRILAGVALITVLLVSTARAYQGEHVTDGGSVAGTIKYAAPAPTPAPLHITKDRDVCGTRVNDPSLLIGRDGGIANAVVTLDDISKGEPLKPDPAVKFDQKGCEYIPHVAVFPAGSTVLILNSDGILHNIHTESAVNPAIDLAQPGFKKQIRVTIEKPEIIKVTCDAHNWMEGWWYVVANPYYAVADASGHFMIRNIPPGTYTLRVWQERLGVQSQRVTIRAGASTTADFIMQPRNR
jgi:Polysaccharide lyase family 4, domain II